MRRHSCERCHTVNKRYGAGKRIRCTQCRRLIGHLCCSSVVSYVRLGDGSVFPLHGTTCVDCVPSIPQSQWEANH